MNFFAKQARALVPSAFTSYEAAQPSRHRQMPMGCAPTDHRREYDASTRTTIVTATRGLAKNSGLFRSMVQDYVTYSVGDGLRPQSKARMASQKEKLETRFSDWSEVASLCGRFTLWDLERLVSRYMDIDGEIFVHKTRSLSGSPRIQLIESQRIGDFGETGLSDGIKFHSVTGEPLYYRVLQDNGNAINIPAANIVHLFEAEYVSEARSAPGTTHGVNNLRDAAQLLDMEMHAVKDGADISRILKNEAGEIPDELDDFAVTVGDEEDEITGSDPVALQRIVGGKLVALKTGESLESFESARPSPTFTGFLATLHRDAMASNLPYEFTGDPNGVGGAAIRLVVAKADRRFSDRQIVLCKFVRAVWFYVIGDAIFNRELPAVPEWWKISIVTPRRITVDAGRDATAHRADVEMGLCTLSDSYAERGMEFREEMRRRADDFVYIRQLAEETGVPFEILWRTIRPDALPAKPLDAGGGV